MAGSPATAPKRYSTRRRGTTIPAGQTSIFFTLPAELRLEVYKYALEDCLRDGHAADVSGLFCCCQQIHQEIESEFMTVIRPLLTAKSKWEDSEKVHGVLGMQVLPKLNSKEAELSIKLPLQAAFKVDLMGTTATDIAGLWAVSDILRGMFVRNWSVLRIRLESRASRPISMSQIDRTFKYIIAISRSSTRPAFHHVKHIDRIVLHYDNPSIRLAKKALYDMRVLYQAYCNARHIGPSNIFKQGWLSKASGGRQSGWRLTIDQKQGLDPVAGAIWRMAFVDGYLQSKFNPLGDVPANILNECLGRYKMARLGPVIDISSDSDSDDSSNSDSDDSSDSDSDDSSDSNSDDSADSESDSPSDSGSDASSDTESTDSSDPESDEYSDSEM